MREKQWKIIDEQFISYYGGTGHLISDGECEFWLWHNREESQKVCDMLNEKDQIISDQKIMLNNIAAQRDEFHRGARENAKQIQKLEKEIRILKITYAKCRDCKHANMYSPDFAFLVIDPKCNLGVKPINCESNACEDFIMMGRNSR